MRFREQQIGNTQGGVNAAPAKILSNYLKKRKRDEPKEAKRVEKRPPPAKKTDDDELEVVPSALEKLR